MTRSTHEASEKGMYDEIEMGSSFLLFLKSFCRAAAVPGIIIENHEEIFHNGASSTRTGEPPIWGNLGWFMEGYKVIFLLGHRQYQG